MAGIRSKAKSFTKRIGRAFGSSEILDNIGAMANELESIKKQSENNVGRFEELKCRVDSLLPYLRFYYNNEAAKNIHPLLFEKYRNCNEGKELAIVACGPSLDNYKTIKGVKHIAINRAYRKKGVKYDYIFMHDKQLIEESGSELKALKADKFIAFATGIQNAESFNASSEQVSSIGAKRFLISDVFIPDINGGQFDVIQPDITKGMLFDRGGGTVFSALQFALFTHPKKIYLVGCDCSRDGYFNGAKSTIKQLLLDKTEYLWREVKVFMDQYYPDIEIVSVNPVGLKGLFSDLYQK